MNIVNIGIMQRKELEFLAFLHVRVAVRLRLGLRFRLWLGLGLELGLGCPCVVNCYYFSLRYYSYCRGHFCFSSWLGILILSNSRYDGMCACVCKCCFRPSKNDDVSLYIYIQTKKG